MHRTISKKLLRLILCLLVILAAKRASAANQEHEKPIWLAVTRPIFVQAIKPLEEKRNTEGFETVISTQPVSEAIDALKRQPAFLLLVGDDEPGKENESWYIPSRRRKLYRWRTSQENEFASDTLWGDFDGDLVPDIPVGRIPVRTAEQLQLVVNKILTYENRQPTLDDLRLPVWAGTAAYDQVSNYMATELLLNLIQMYASKWLIPWVISANPMHSLCGWPFEQPVMFTKQLKRGGAMAVLMGHGSEKSFYSMQFNGQQLGYSAEIAKQGLTTSEPAPAMVIIACSTGKFTESENCLAESLLSMPGGPVAVIGATTESHPLTNYFSGLCLLQEHGEKDKRFGSVWLAAQRKAMKTRDLIIERMLVDVEGKLEEKMNVAKLRRDQILMYALLGDPALRMHLPDKLNCRIKHSADGWHWEADKPDDASKLYVGFRKAGQKIPPVTQKLDKDAAQKLFEQANATFAFEQVNELTAEQDWRGTIDQNKEGILRLVAIGPKTMYAACLNLRLSELDADK